MNTIHQSNESGTCPAQRTGRRRWQFSLKALILVSIYLCMGLAAYHSWATYCWQSKIIKFRKHGFYVSYGFSHDSRKIICSGILPPYSYYDIASGEEMPAGFDDSNITWHLDHILPVANPSPDISATLAKRNYDNGILSPDGYLLAEKSTVNSIKITNLRFSHSPLIILVSATAAFTLFLLGLWARKRRKRKVATPEAKGGGGNNG